MFRFVVIAGLSTLLAGCGILRPNHMGGISTAVSPDQYGERLCRHLDLEDYSGCMSQVLDYFEQPQPDAAPGDKSTTGPLAVMMGSDVYIGNYRTSLLMASFHVTNGTNSCNGSYNAFRKSEDALFDVYCTDGRSGWADILLDHGGRNGIGKFNLDDGSQGDIVFGRTALGQIEPYPYRP